VKVAKTKAVEICRYCKEPKEELVRAALSRSAELMAEGVEENKAWRQATRCEAAVKAGSFPFHAWTEVAG
jgi:hypothetical protein